MSQLALMDRQAVEGVLNHMEDISHVDVSLDEDSRIHFSQGSDATPQVQIGSDQYQMTSDGLFETARGVGIPKTYSEKCPSDLLFQNINYWFSGHGVGKLRFFIQEGKVIGCHHNRPGYYTNMQLLNIADEVIGTDNILGYYQVGGSLQHSMFSIVTNRAFEALVDDPLYGGVQIQNSITGDYGLEVSPYIFRQWCSNGCVTEERTGRWSHRNDGKISIDSWLRPTLNEALHGLTTEFERIRRLTEVPVRGHVSSTLRSLCQKFLIPVRTQSEIVGEAESQNNGAGPETMYDLWNCITKVASHSSRLSYASSRQLQFVAGDVVRETSLCPQCHQIVVTGQHDHES